jgi:hypothetical protein
MSKFKESDEIVRVISGTSWAPLGFTCNYMTASNGFGFYFDIHGRKTFIDEDNWELAEDTSKTVYTQEMHDKGELPAVGMSFATEAGEYIAKYTNEKSVCFTDENGFLVAINRGYAKPIPAPIELIDGNAYMFDYHKNRKPVIGVYSKSNETFLTVSDDHFAFNCTNIRPMTVAESK